MYRIKEKPEDFIVEEITPEGKPLEINKAHKFKSKSSGDQLICVLEKNNWDTNLALRALCDALHCSRKRAGFAGTKDKRALTAQRISLWKIKKEEAEGMKVKDMRLIPLQYSDERIELGDLEGNRFTIKVYTKQKPLKLAKIANYFGVQRFGEARPITGIVGEHIVRGSPEKAVKTYLAEVFEAEREEAKFARKRLACDWNYAEALQYFPRNLRFERTMIAHLANHPNDYAGALRALPKFLKLMFVHAFQSMLFNEFLDEVVKRKLKVKEGPLYGYELQLENDLEKEILEKHHLMLEDFYIHIMPELSSRGSRRELFVPIKGFRVMKKGKDFCVLRFSLPKGSYATSALEQIFAQAKETARKARRPRRASRSSGKSKK